MGTQYHSNGEGKLIQKVHMLEGGNLDFGGGGGGWDPRATPSV